MPTSFCNAQLVHRCEVVARGIEAVSEVATDTLAEPLPMRNLVADIREVPSLGWQVGMLEDRIQVVGRLQTSQFRDVLLELLKERRGLETLEDGDQQARASNGQHAHGAAGLDHLEANGKLGQIGKLKFAAEALAATLAPELRMIDVMNS